MSEYLNNEEIKQKIDHYIEGKLSPREVDELWAELVQHEEYMDYMKSVANIKTLVGKRSGVQQDKEMPVSANAKTYLYYAAAAVVALLIGVVGVLNFASESPDTMISPIANVEVEYYRSADGTSTLEEGEEVVQQAIMLANEDNTDQAIHLLQTALDDDKLSVDHRVKRYLTLGSLYYNSQQYDEAIEAYSNVIAKKDQAGLDLLDLEKAFWYRGNAYLQTSEQEQAQADIKEAYELNGAYRRVAERYLQKLSK